MVTSLDFEKFKARAPARPAEAEASARRHGFTKSAGAQSFPCHRHHTHSNQKLEPAEQQVQELARRIIGEFFLFLGGRPGFVLFDVCCC